MTQSRDQPSTLDRLSLLPPLSIGLVLLLALVLRLYGIDWDSGHLFHPDERAILMKVNDMALPWPPNPAQLLTPQSPLNPHWFPYGSLPLYLLKLTSYLVSFILGPVSFTDLRLVGRALSALFDTGTVLLVYLLGARLYSRGIGLLGALFSALAVFHIQLSHFFAVDTVLTFFILLALYFAVRVMEHGDLSSAALAGVAAGLALATKVSAAPLFIALGVAHLLYHLRRREDEPRFSLGEGLSGALGGLLLSGAVALVSFIIVQPYALIDSSRFIGDTVEQSEMVRRLRDYPYTRQYVNTTPYLYHLWQSAIWGLGLPLGVSAWGGLIFSMVAALRRRLGSDILILSWVIPYFALIGSFEVKFPRYLLPIVPLLCLLGARMLLSWRLRPGWNRGLAAGAMIVVIALSALYALAYLSIYSRPHPAVAASSWINGNVAKGSRMVKEHWEEGLPRLEGYEHGELRLYDGDNAAKLEHLVAELSQADYLVFYSNRLYGTIPRLPRRYPLSTRYYRLLFSGELGFRLAHFETSYPQLLGLSLVDDTFSRPGLPPPPPLDGYTPSTLSLNLGYADESFTVYDHPKVLIFEKVEALTPAELRARLAPGLTTGKTRPTGLLLSEAEAAIAQAGGTWSEIFDREGLSNRFPLFAWLLLVELISLAALPPILLLLRPLPDRGYLLAKGLGILAVAYVGWLAASLRLATWSGTTLGLGLGGMLLLALMMALWRRSELVQMIRQKGRLFLFEEGIFLVAFLAFYAIRLWNPDLWHPFRGGEKPMDFAYLNAIIKTTYFPPYDPWFAGGQLNYYYFGQVIVAALIKLSGIVPAVAYNLAIPLLFALTVGGVFSVVLNLVELARAHPTSQRVSLAAVVAGLAGAAFVTVLGNLDGAIQLVQRLWALGKVSPDASLPILDDLIRVGAGLGRLLDGTALPTFDYWRSSRMMPPQISITEFPYFTFLFADLHAHLIALPFTVIVIGLALAVAVTGRQRGGLHGRGLLLIALLALPLGALRWINTWDFPTYLLLSLGVLMVGEYLWWRRPGLAFLGWLVLKGGLLFGLATVLFWPFQQSYRLFYSGVKVSQEVTPLEQYLAIHGLFVFLVVSLLLYELYVHLQRKSVFQMARLLLRHRGRLSRLLKLYRKRVRGGEAAATGFLLSFPLAAALLLILVLLRPNLIVFLFLILELLLALSVLWMGDEHPSAPVRLSLALLIGLAAAIGIGVDLFTVQGDINRMNTVFKFYLQAWVLYGIAAAYALWRLSWGRERGLLPRKGRPPTWLRPLWWSLLALFIAAAALYPLEATPVRARDRFSLLPAGNDGMAFMRVATYHDEKGPIELYWDYEAIRWLQDNVEGSPVVLEGHTPQYRWGGRVSVYTGLPTLIGFDWEQTQQRWGYAWMVEERVADVRRLYTSEDIAETLRLLHKYRVRYIYLGELERLYYPGPGLAKFDQMVGEELELAYENRGVKIYRLR